MAKLIKRVGGDEAPPQAEFTQIAEARRTPVIDRETFEARAGAQGIRERAESQAADLVAEATARSEAMLAEAQQEAERMRADAEAAGREAGRQEGIGQLSEAVARASARLQAAEAQLVPQLGSLAVSIARKILGRELEFAPEAVVELVKQALADKARQRREITLRVHPDDLRILRDSRADLAEVLSRSKEIALIEDPKVERFGVIIETDAGTIDAQLETQLQVFERVLAKLD